MLYQLTFVFLLTTCVWSATVKRGYVEWFEIMPAKEETVRTHKILSRQRPIVDYSPYEQAWSEFKDLHGKSYEVEEEKKRFQIFRENVDKIEQHNKKFLNGHTTFTQGINQFTDLTHAEYIQYNKLKKRAQTPSDCSNFLKSNDAVTAKSVDWRDKGYVTDVKNQGQCGSCWSFSTTGSLEGQNFRKTGQLISLSEQQLVDCSTEFGNEGCNGGLMDQAFRYIYKFGIESEDKYPYKAEEGTCKYKKRLVVANDTGCVDVKSESETALKSATSSIGPISVAIDASHQSFQMYESGVYDEENCSSTQLDHGVLVVGYGTSSDGKDYWIVKNSWGKSWGEEGYIKMSRNNDNQCGIATQASYPLV